MNRLTEIDIKAEMVIIAVVTALDVMVIMDLIAVNDIPGVPE